MEGLIIDECPICSTHVKDTPLSPQDSFDIDCPRCGNFNMTRGGSSKLQGKPLNNLQIANASGWIRQNQGITIASDNIETLRNLRTPTVAEKANKLLLYYSKDFPIPGQAMPCDINATNFKKEHLHLLAITWCTDFDEFAYLFHTYLLQTKRFLIRGQSTSQFIISPEGWAYIDNLKQINPDSQIAFVAMWFDDKVKPVWTEAIKPGIEAAGYEPLRMDMYQHNNRIDDEIIARIRRSKFIVADFTGQRGGVYFEAGFALGMGLQVVWVCPKDELKDVHFDNNHFNFITWEDGKLDDLKEALQYRIERTLGRGTYNPSSS